MFSIVLFHLITSERLVGQRFLATKYLL